MLKLMHILTLPVLLTGFGFIFFLRDNQVRTAILLFLLAWCIVLAKLDDSDKRLGRK